jgi:hypothetical protein
MAIFSQHWRDPEVREVQIKQQSAALFRMHPRHWQHAPGVHGWVVRFSAGSYDVLLACPGEGYRQ